METKKKYIKPQLDVVQIDNQISLIMTSLLNNPDSANPSDNPDDNPPEQEQTPYGN